MAPPIMLSYPFEPGSLADAGSVSLLYGRFPRYRQVMRWLEGFVTQPHPGLGRPGAVCPRLAPALDRNLVYLVAARTASTSAREACAIGGALPDLYRRLFPDPRSFRTGALLTVFPDLPEQGAGEFIDGGHAQLRMRFVASGLMIGEFHPTSAVASVRNPRLLVMRCPVPMFAVRALSRHDLLFLDRAQTPPHLRVRYLGHMLHHLGDQLRPVDLADLRERIAVAEGQQ